MPIPFFVLLGCLTTKRGAKTFSLPERKEMSVVGPAATIASILGFYCRLTKAKYLQGLFNLQMWLGGCKKTGETILEAPEQALTQLFNTNTLHIIL